MFCRFFHEKCKELGLITYIATPTSLPQDSQTLHLVSEEGPRTVKYDKLVLTAGPWTAALASTLGLPVPRISNLPGHSILIRPRPDTFDPCSESQTVFAGLSGKGVGLEAAFTEESTTGKEKVGGYTRSVEFATR